ncbi:MAG: response regulator [Lachnospiraceae bacterium]|nr:response regulator [Lachnospiraceae bacterium]
MRRVIPELGLNVDKVLIVSTNADKLRRYEHAFDGLYKLKSALLSGTDILGSLGGFIPDCVVVYAEGLTRQKMFPLMDVIEDERYAGIPVILVADPEDQRLYHENLFKDPDYITDTSVAAGKLLDVVERMILSMARPKHVLVVDDDVVALRLMKSYLEDKFKVTCVKSGEMALKFVEKQFPDIVLLDCFMPGLDGPGTLQRIRYLENGRNVPVIFLTGNSEKDMVMKSLSLHPSGFLVKPVKREELMKRIKEVLG